MDILPRCRCSFTDGRPCSLTEEKRNIRQTRVSTRRVGAQSESDADEAYITYTQKAAGVRNALPMTLMLPSTIWKYSLSLHEQLSPVTQANAPHHIFYPKAKHIQHSPQCLMTLASVTFSPQSCSFLLTSSQDN